MINDNDYTFEDIPIVVLRSNDICFLGALRSAYAAGIPVIPVVFDWDGAGPWFSEYSKYFHNVITIPNPYLYEEEAVACLSDLGKQLVAEFKQRIILVPSSDTNLMLIQNHYKELMPYFVQMGDEGFDSDKLDIIDKSSCYNVLTQNGIAIPQTIACNHITDVNNIADNISYPCIYKPSVKDYDQSFYREHNRLKAVECMNRSELIDKMSEEMVKDRPLVVQSKITVEHKADEVPFYLYADANQNIRLAATGLKRSVHPDGYGTATVLELTWRKELLPIAENIVRALKWRGILMIEFMKDSYDGQWKVVEINCRPWLFVDFYRRWGFNFIEYLYADAQDRLDEYPLMRSPSDVLVQLKPVHINILEEYKKRIELDENSYDVPITDWLTSIGGIQSYPYYDPDDQEPGREELNLMSHLYPINAIDVERYITGQVVDHV